MGLLKVTWSGHALHGTALVKTARVMIRWSGRKFRQCSVATRRDGLLCNMLLGVSCEDPSQDILQFMAYIPLGSLLWYA